MTTKVEVLVVISVLVEAANLAHWAARNQSVFFMPASGWLRTTFLGISLAVPIAALAFATGLISGFLFLLISASLPVTTAIYSIYVREISGNMKSL
jgi:hypothetical protein